MKWNWDKRYFQWGITIFLVVASLILFHYFIYHGDTVRHGIGSLLNILMPVIYGAVLAYLLAPIINFWERKLFGFYQRKKQREPSTCIKKIVRFVGVFLVLFLVIVLLFGLLYLIVPQVVDSISILIRGLPGYLTEVQNWALALLKDNPDLEEIISSALKNVSEDLQNWITNVVMPYINTIVVQISLGVVDVIVVLKNLIIGFIVSIYILISKELFAAQGKKLLYSIFKPSRVNLLLENLRFTNRTFGGFISGKLIDSLIIGVLCFLGTRLIGTPYGLLISVIVGVTNIIPFFGPYIGAIPSALLILMVDPLQCLYFVIFIIVLQQFDGNILGPKILGNSTGLSSFWVLVSLLLGGGLFGLVGMLVGVPVFAVLYAGIKSLVNQSLTKRQLPTDTEQYLNVRSVNAKTLEFAYTSTGTSRKSKTIKTPEEKPVSEEQGRAKSEEKSEKPDR